jgi:hypothetical protein
MPPTRRPNAAPRSSCVAVVVVVVVCVFGAAACPPPATLPGVDTDPLSHLPKHEEQRQALCARGHDDAVAAVFCADDAPSLSSLRELQQRLDLSMDPALPDDQRPGFSLIAHSSALPARSVTSLNPGSVIVSLPESDRADLNGDPGRRRGDGNVVALAYARGDQVVELAVTPPGGEARFYLLRYEQACNDGEGRDVGGCSNADLFGEATERDWVRWSIYDDGDLGDSVFDCLQCHQPDGPGTPRIYRMQEPENPWTHWSSAFTLSGQVLLDETLHAWGREGVVAGIPGPLLPKSDPVVVEDLLRFTDTLALQRNVFDAPIIEREVQQSARGQPVDNSVPGQSATWDLIYDAAVRGEAIPPPYHDVKVTDADKAKDAARAIIAFRDGSAGDLPDLRDLFDDDALAGMSHRPKPGLDGRALLVHACAQCHNPRLDPTLTRARFDALDVDGLPRSVKDRAIERLQRPHDDRFLMPPRLFRSLSDDEIARAVAVLRE